MEGELGTYTGKDPQKILVGIDTPGFPVAPSKLQLATCDLQLDGDSRYGIFAKTKILGLFEVLYGK